MFDDFLIPFLIVGLAELGDKTQIAILLLASKTRNHVLLLLGVVIAFIITNGLAILIGNFITTLFDIQYIKIISGILFIIFGIYSLWDLKDEDDEKHYELKNPFLSGFLAILILEMGDKTQLTSGLLATKYNLIFVFLGVISSLTLLSSMAVYAGKFIIEKINRKLLSFISAILFIMIGILTMIQI